MHAHLNEWAKGQYGRRSLYEHSTSVAAVIFGVFVCALLVLVFLAAIIGLFRLLTILWP